MSTILRALKKAEEGRARDNLSEKIIAGGGTMRFPRARRPLILALAVPAVLAVGALVYYRGAPPGFRGPAAGERAAAAPSTSPRSPGPDVAGNAPPHLHLDGIMGAPSSAVAIINGEPVAEGGELRGARILKVGMLEVRYLYGGREHVLRMEEEEVSNPKSQIQNPKGGGR